MSRNRYVYAVAISWYRKDENGELKLYDNGVSTLAYDNLEAAQAFIRSRCSQIAEHGWKGTHGTNVGESVYEVRELMVEGSK